MLEKQGACKKDRVSVLGLFVQYLEIESCSSGKIAGLVILISFLEQVFNVCHYMLLSILVACKSAQAVSHETTNKFQNQLIQVLYF